MGGTGQKGSTGKSGKGARTRRISERMRRLGAAVLAIAMLLVLPGKAYAHTVIDTDRAGSLTLSYETAAGSMEGVEFEIYQAADVDLYVRYTLTKDFASSGVDLGSAEDSSDWKAIAETLLAYAAAAGVQKTASGKTDENGRVAFEDLTPGLYLVAGETVAADGYSYTVAPAIVQVPSLDENDEWVYDVACDVKSERELVREEIDISVEKIWDDGDYSGRPSSVTVQLLRDGEIYEEVSLSEKNGWKYAWSGLENAYEKDGEAKVHTWQVSEKDVPDGYSVQIENKNYTFRVTNTRPADGTTPTPGTPDTSTPSTTLPQTGQLNWPVPVLAACGLLFILAGVWLRRKGSAGRHGGAAG